MSTNNEPLSRRIGRILAERAAGLGRTEAMIRKETGLPQQTVNRLLDPTNESEPLIGNVRAVARYLGLRLDEACGDQAPPAPPLRPRDQQVVAAYNALSRAERRIVDRALALEEE